VISVALSAEEETSRCGGGEGEACAGIPEGRLTGDWGDTLTGYRGGGHNY